MLGIASVTMLNLLESIYDRVMVLKSFRSYGLNGDVAGNGSTPQRNTLIVRQTAVETVHCQRCATSGMVCRSVKTRHQANHEATRLNGPTGWSTAGFMDHRAANLPPRDNHIWSGVYNARRSAQLVAGGRSIARGDSSSGIRNWEWTYRYQRVASTSRRDAANCNSVRPIIALLSQILLAGHPIASCPASGDGQDFCQRFAACAGGVAKAANAGRWPALLPSLHIFSPMTLKVNIHQITPFMNNFRYFYLFLVNLKQRAEIFW